MVKNSESKENLVPPKSPDVEAGPSTSQKKKKSIATEYILTNTDKKFLLTAERGDVASVKRLIEEFKDKPDEFNINCTDPLGRTSLVAAIENENIDLINILLEAGIEVKDALLHAISEEYVEGVETLLCFEEEHHEAGTPYSWESVESQSALFTSDITPLILAAHRNNYEILKTLLDRGATLPMPHDVRCGCDECITSSSTDSLRHSQARINAYKALSSSSLIALSSKDPILTSFELSWELRRLSFMETEFRIQYNEMRQNVQEFVTSLLDYSRTSLELEIMLNYNNEPTTDVWEPGERQTLERLKLAIKYKQKLFVAHPNVQQLLAAIWYEGLPGFRRKSMPDQLMQVAKLGCMFPMYSTIYMLSPNSDMGKFMKKPFVKFICHSASYMLFLGLLGAQSQRIEYLALEFIGTPFFLEILENWRHYERGALPGPTEFFIIVYIFSYIWSEIRALWEGGILDYIGDLWNIIDFISNTFYVTWIGLRCTSFFIVTRDSWAGLDPWYPREQWHPFDPMLVSEGVFAAGMIFSFLKLVHIFSINPHLGPLQVSLGRMIIDIIKFFFIYTLVLFAFGCGLNQLLWYYSDLEKKKCYHADEDIPDFEDNEKACIIWRRFANLFETSQSLFWASFGLVDLMAFELEGIKSFTRFWAMLMFGSYSVINIIVLLNMLIAMMSNSYQIISERSDTEWKFARTQLWLSYFEDGDTVPPPFNLCPTIKMLNIGKTKRSNRSLMRRCREKSQLRHEDIMQLLVRRYVTAEQRKRDDFGITEDDVIEIRQDISSLRFELIDILRGNGMKTPDVDKASSLANKKGKVMERRILGDFQIGAVTDSGEAKVDDIFSSIAKTIAKKSNTKSMKKEDWNEVVRRNTITRDPIGSRRESLKRRSLRRAIISEANEGKSISTDKLLEYNPKLSEVTKTTRTAYVKFMRKANVMGDGDVDGENAPVGENAKATVVDEKTKPKDKPILKSTTKTEPVKKPGPDDKKPPTSPGKPTAGGDAPGSKSQAPSPPPPPPKTSPKAAGTPAATTKTTTATTNATTGTTTAAASTTSSASTTGSSTATTTSTAATTKASGSSSTTTSATTTAAASTTATASTSSGATATAKPGDKKDDAAASTTVTFPPTTERGKSKVTGKTISGWL